MLLAHISDFHVFADRRETPLVRPDAEAAARRVVADLAAFSPALDGIAFTGDLTDGGSRQDYRLLKDILSPLKCPIYVVPGNHDKRAGLRAAFADALPFETTHFLNYETRLGNLRILALDTLIEGRGEGAMERESLDWLRRKLLAPEEQHVGQQTVILMHHTPFASGMEALDRASLIGGREELAAIVRQYRAPLVILAGHIHRPYGAIWNGAYCAVGGSPAFQVGLDLAASQHEPGCVDQPYAYYVYKFADDGHFAVHSRFVTLEQDRENRAAVFGKDHA